MGIFHFLRMEQTASVRSFVRSFRSTSTILILGWLPGLIFFNTRIAEIATINGASMYPYLNTSYNESLQRDQCLVWKWKPWQGLQRGMLVVFQYAWDKIPATKMSS